MLKDKKARIIDGIAEDLSRSTVVVTTGYQGMTAKDMAELRQILSGAGIGFRVVKNTLARFAAEKADRRQLMSLIEGPVALAFGYDDMVKPAKVLSQYVKSTGAALQIKGALVGDQVVSASGVQDLASLPPRDVLLSRLVGQLQAPMRSLQNVLSSPFQRLLTSLQAIIER
jgi:large subunit ribosomal protein L10